MADSLASRVGWAVRASALAASAVLGVAGCAGLTHHDSGPAAPIVHPGYPSFQDRSNCPGIMRVNGGDRGPYSWWCQTSEMP